LLQADFCESIQLSYPALSLPDLTVIALAGLHLLDAEPSLAAAPRAGLFAIVKGAGLATAVFATIALLFPSRVAYAIRHVTSFSANDVGGWKLDLISPMMLSGISAGWTFPSLRSWPALQLLAPTSMAIIGMTGLLRQDRPLCARPLQLMPLTL
jgi:hypothetical protein